MNYLNQNQNLTQSKDKIYLDLWEEAKGRDYTNFFNQLESDFGVKITKDLINFTDNLALKTQITIKKSKPLYLHGYLLYSALTNYLNNQNEQNEQNKEINILETGTARGFSAIMMAKAVDDYLKKQETEIQTQTQTQPQTHTNINAWVEAEAQKRSSTGSSPLEEQVNLEENVEIKTQSKKKRKNRKKKKKPKTNNKLSTEEPNTEQLEEPNTEHLEEPNIEHLEESIPEESITKPVEKKIKIHTIDIIPFDKTQKWNSYKEPNCTLLELISEYDYLKKYINFITGDTKEKIDEIIVRKNRTIDFAFLDAHHNYEYLKMELNKVRDNVSRKQTIICDDYTIYNNLLIVRNPLTNRLQRKLNYQYPGIIKAIEEFKTENLS